MEVLNLATMEKQDEILQSVSYNDTVHIVTGFAQSGTTGAGAGEIILVDISGEGVLFDFSASLHQATTSNTRLVAQIIVDGQNIISSPNNVVLNSMRESTNSHANLLLNLKFHNSLVIKIHVDQGSYCSANAQAVYKLI